MIKRTLIASAVSLVMLTACSDNNSADPGENGQTDNGGENNGQNNGEDGSTGSGQPGAGERRLRQLDNSDAFFDALREGLARQNANLVTAVDTNESFNSAPEIAVGLPQAETEGTADGGAGASDSVQATSPAVPIDVTTTNVQEVGVDEQDRMKSDGEFLYILDNQFNYDGPGILPVEEGPANTVNLTVEVLPVDEPVDNSVDEASREPFGLPVEGGVAGDSFFGPTDTTTTVRILSLQPEAPDATSVTDLEIDLGGAFADGMYLYKTAARRNLILTSTNFANYYQSWNDSQAFSRTRSVVTKLDVTNPSQSSVENTFQIDGQIISSRRIGNNLFLASRFYPTIVGLDPYSMSPEDYQSALESADLTSALPKMTQTSNGAVTELVDPAGCFVAAEPDSTDYYYTPDIVSLVVVDLETMQLQDSECFLGSSETLYATPTSVFLATTRWDYSAFPQIDLQDSVTATTFVDPRVDTDIHQFSIDGAQLTYSGSGVVAGHLGWNPLRKPFRMSEKDGYLRVATFAEAQNESVSPINVSVLKLEGDGELTTVAQLPNANNPEHIGKPGEQLYASRYLGDRGYLVTFRQTDPLYVIDFANPEDPKLAGELEIDGYSDYLQPIGQDYLLGIGRDAVPAPDGFGDGFGALIQGVKLSLFNVADASNPFEVQSLVIGERGTHAAALQNHRAITVQAATDSRPTRITFGIDVAGLAEPRPAGDPTRYYQWNFTGLHGFEVNTGDGAGIEQRGVMVVNSAANQSSSSFGFYGDDRSVIVGDSVYYIHGSEVFAANWFDLGSFTGPR